MSNKRDENVENEEAKVEKPKAPESAGGDALDLEGMDLSVETVEERISPSETNVFDK
ncbi:MAG: hypothetical protein AAGA20_11215 [Planctomycetota bacterium]